MEVKPSGTYGSTAAETSPQHVSRDPEASKTLAARAKARKEKNSEAKGDIHYSGMPNSVAGILLTGKDFIEILKASKAIGVLRLHITHGSVTADFAAGPTLQTSVLVQESKPELSLADERVMDEIDDAQDLMDNPLGYEQRIIDSHTRTHAETYDREA